MAILPNGLNLSQAFIGNTEIQSAWLGNTKIWEKSGGGTPRPQSTIVLFHFNDNLNEEVGLHSFTSRGTISYTSGKFSNALDVMPAYSKLYTTPILNGLTSYTIATWVYIGNETGGLIFSSGGSDSTWLYAQYTDSYSIQIGGYTGSQWKTAHLVSGYTPSGKGWTHIAFVRNGNESYLFIDGVKRSTSNVVDFSLVNNFYVGCSSNYHPSLALDEFLVADTALWTSDFTPPTSQYE